MSNSFREKVLSLTGLFVVYTCAMLLMFSLSLGSYFSLRTTVKTFETITEREFVELRRLFYLQDITRQSAEPIFHYVAWGAADEAALFGDRIEEVDEAFADILGLAWVSGEQREYVLLARTQWQEAAAIGRAVFAIPPESKAELHDAEDMFANRITATINTLYEAHNIRIADGQRNKDAATERHQQALIFTLASFVGGIVIFFFASLVLARQIIRPLRTLRSGIRRFGAGDLSHRIELQVDNELGDLAEGFNAMADRLESDQIALEQLAIRDSLTNLCNRREFERLLGEEIHRSVRYRHPLSLLLIDIDKFKEINDSLGHRAGDQALRLVASSIRDISRKGDVVARYGGDELAVLMPETPDDDAMALAERIRRLVAQQHVQTADGRMMRKLTLSIGVATTSGELGTGEKLVDAADRAMYVAKAEGRNRVHRSDPPQGTLPMAMP